MTNQALQELTDLLNPDIETYAGNTPLLMAMGAVGKALGVRVRSPVKNRPDDSPETIARASGFRVRRITLEQGWWQDDSGAMLGYLETEERPVALLPKGDRGYEILDPVSGKRIPVSVATARYLSPTAYTFYRPFPDQQLSPLNLLQFAFRGRDRDLTNIVLFGVFASLVGMLVPQATAALVDSVIPDGDRQLLLQIGIGLLAASFAMSLLQLTRGILFLRLQTAMSADVQAAVWDRLLKLEVSFFRQYPTGDVEQRVSAISEIRDRLNSTVMTVLLTSFFSLLNLGLLFYYSSSLAMVALVVVVFSSALTTIAGLMTRHKFRSLQELSGEIMGLIVETLEGISKLRVAAAEEQALVRWRQKYAQQMRLTLLTQQVEDFLALFNTAIPGVSAIALFYFAVAALDPDRGGLSTGRFLAFNAAFGTLIAGVSALSNTVIDVLEISVLWDRAQPILHAVPETLNEGVDPGELSGALTLERVWFRYERDLPWVLEELTLEAKPGEFIGITGPSGSGKSTILRLLLGFEKPTQGRVLYGSEAVPKGNRDLTTLDIAVVRSQLGVVLQNSRLMSSSIGQIIAGGRGISLDEAWAAARMAGLAEEIEAMPMGMHTRISEAGGNLSGGQCQRLLIARALVRKPKILLFDEATSSLDNRTQDVVTRSLAELGMTRVVVAHRLSTLEQCDRVYRL